MPQKILIRCGLNKYKTPLFSYDEKGIYVRCKDCRIQERDGSKRRGAFHLVPWSLILSYLNESGTKYGVDFVQDSGGDSSVITEPPIIIDNTVGKGDVDNAGAITREDANVES